jgi:hypothetical protein
MMKYVFLYLSLFFSTMAFSNVSMPGIFQTGGSASLSLLYPADSNEIGKIEMAREKVAIDLYQGYAVVKGSYLLINSEPDSVFIRMGYPKYSFYEGMNIGGSFSMEYDSLNDLRVFADGKELKILPVMVDGNVYDLQNWYTWETTFLPQDSQVIEVYFTMTTDMAQVREGYAKEKINGLAYVLETGRYWKDSINNGEILVKLRDGISFSDIHGISPTGIFQINEENGLLLYAFENLEPSYKDNLIIALENFERDTAFPFDANKREELYSNVDETWAIDTDDMEWEEKTFPNPYNLPTPGIGWVFLAIVIFLVLAGTAIVLYFGYRAYRYFKK